MKRFLALFPITGVAPAGVPHSTGRIPYVADAPIDQFDPGNYVVCQGREIAEEDPSVSLEL